MALAVGHGELARRLSEALGLKHCRRFTLTCAIDEVVTLEAECITDENELEKVTIELEEWAEQKATSS